MTFFAVICVSVIIGITGGFLGAILRDAYRWLHARRRIR